MFFKSDHRKKSSNPVLSIFRLFLSLIIMAVLGIGLLQAYRAFSGYDPMSMSPKATFESLMASDSLYDGIISLLSFSPQNPLKPDQVLQGIPGIPDTQDQVDPNAQITFKFAILGDSHTDTQNLEKALNQAKNLGVSFIVMMGDLSDVGTIEELTASKNKLETLGIPYYVGAGDHDLWDSRDKGNSAETNFKTIFGTPYQSISYDNVRLLLIYNSDNYLGLDGVQLKWIEDELERTKTDAPKRIFVFAPTPLYHPSSDHVMGKVSPKLKSQAEHLISIFKKAGVDQVFSADTHFYSTFVEPTNELKMTTVGALTSEKNAQTPRFSLVEVYSDGNYRVVETEVK
jgi:hypothetical protein